MLRLMKALHYWISLKKAIAKTRKRATFWTQLLNNKLFLRCYILKSIFLSPSLFLTTHLHNTCCLFAFYVTQKNDCLPYVSCFALFVFGISGSRTFTASKMEHFVGKFNIWKSLLLKRSILYKCSVWVSLAVSYSMMIQLIPFYIVSVSLF